MTSSMLTAFRRPPAALSAGVLICGLLLAGCGSDDSTGGSSAAAKVDDAAAGGPVAAAQAFMAKYVDPPGTLGVSTPLPSAPAPGKTIVYLQCEVQQCVDLADGVKDGARSVGWDSKILNWKSSDPASLLAAMQQALELKPAPAYVVVSGLPAAIWSAKIPDFTKAGIKLVAASLGPVPLGDTVIANLLDNDDAGLQGKILADWVIADSQGKAKILQQDLPDFPTIAAVGKGIRDEISATCPACAVTRLNITGAQLASGGVTPAIVSALQRDASIGYLASSDIALAAGLPAALKAAGLDKVKIVGGAASPADVQTLQAGTGSAFMANDLGFVGWLSVDVAVRHAAGVAVQPNGGGIPQQLLTKQTAGSGTVKEFPAGYQDTFKKLWQVG